VLILHIEKPDIFPCYHSFWSNSKSLLLQYLASKASETLLGITNRNLIYMYIYMYIYTCVVRETSL